MKKQLMWAITHFEIDGRNSIVFHGNRACIFSTKKEAQDFDTKVLRPQLEHLIEGRPATVSGGWFAKDEIVHDYLPAAEERKIKRILETLSIAPVVDIKFGVIK